MDDHEEEVLEEEQPISADQFRDLDLSPMELSFSKEFFIVNGDTTSSAWLRLRTAATVPTGENSMSPPEVAQRLYELLSGEVNHMIELERAAYEQQPVYENIEEEAVEVVEVEEW